MNSIEILRPTNRSRPIPRCAAAFSLLTYTVAIPLLAGMFLSAQAQTTFTKITTGPIVTITGNSVGAGWADFDNDGFPELYVTRWFGQSNLFYSGGLQGEFNDTSSKLIGIGDGLPRNSSGCTWGDFDNDGNVDLFVANIGGEGGISSQKNLLFRNNGDGTFTRITSGPIANNIGSSLGCNWIDYDNDGRLDLFVANINSAKFLYHNEGNGTFARITTGNMVNNTLGGAGCAWGDYDNDGYLDLFWAGGDAGVANALYHNNRDGTFTKVTTGPIVTGSFDSRSGAWGDYNHDGFLDLCVVNRGGLGIFLYRNNGNGTFTKVTSGVPVTDNGEFQGCAWGDYDNDGYLDLFVCEHFGNNRLYRNNGDGTFTKITSGNLVNDGGNSGACAWEDIDNDGFLDLFVANGVNITAQVNFLYRNDGNSNTWIKVRCVGTVSNRSAIGTKVRVQTVVNGAPHWQLRQIGGGDGLFSPTSLTAHFGLGDATNVETLRIEWPSGTVQELQNIAAKQYLTITEPSRLLVSATNGIPQLSIRGGRNLQYDFQTSTNLTAWSFLAAITITNLDGTALVTDTNATAADASFYRAVLH